MAISNFIPTVWSEALVRELDREYIGVKNCNRNFEGDIREKGSAVKICSIGEISVFDYTKNTDMSTPQTLSDSAKTLTIDQAKAFNFQIDDIDRAQANPSLMKMAMRQAASTLADVADRYVYSLYTEADSDNKISVTKLTTDNVVDTLLSARKLLLKNGVNSNIPTSLEVSPDVAAILLKTKILTTNENRDAVDNGSLGSFIGFDVYVSPNIATDETGNFKCFARTKRAISFAEQVNEVEAYRPESRFADALKGLHLYGAKVVYPEEFILLDIGI